MEGTPYVNLVFCAQKGGRRAYLFQLPLGACTSVGQELLVETAGGESRAVAVCNSFIVPFCAMREIARAVGAYQPLKSVRGRIERVLAVTEKASRF